jgi:predicted RNA-binding Zn-ribbon protein involved in translation (DUF1610 family)
MKAKLKIEETSAGFQCRVCGRRFRTEEAAFVHQSYDCSKCLLNGLVEE